MLNAVYDLHFAIRHSSAHHFHVAMTDEVTLLDGGMGHELKNRGLSSDGSFLAGALANEGRHAEIVESIHCDFLAAGCEVITTNSFVAVPPGMIESGFASDNESANIRAATLIAASVDRAKAAITRYNNERNVDDKQRPKRIAGCIPPITECYFAEKVPQVADLIPGYKIIITTLIDNGVDILLAETLSTIREAEAILKALAAIQGTHQRNIIPLVWISFTIHDDKPEQLRSGELLIDACRFIEKEAGLQNIFIDAIGINCCAPSSVSTALTILREELKNNEIKCLCYGNCFQTTTSEWIRSLKSSSSSSSCDEVSKSNCHDYDADGYFLPESYAKYAKEWAKNGAAIIGGCCGCSPNHMKSVQTALCHINEDCLE